MKVLKNKRYKALFIAFVLLLSLFFVLPAYAEIGNISANESNMVKYVVGEHNLYRYLVEYDNYNLSSQSIFDNSFGHAWIICPNYKQYEMTVEDFDYFIANCVTFAGIQAPNVLNDAEVSSAYRFIYFDCLTKETVYFMVIASGNMYSNVVGYLEAVNGSGIDESGSSKRYYRFKQNNSNTALDGSKQVYTYIEVRIPHSFSGNTSSIKVKSELVRQNASYPLKMAAKNFLWGDGSVLGLTGGNDVKYYPNYISHNNVNSIYFLACTNQYKTFEEINEDDPAGALVPDFIFSYDSGMADYSMTFDVYTIGKASSYSFIENLMDKLDFIRFNEDFVSSSAFITYECIDEGIYTSSSLLLYVYKVKIYFSARTDAGFCSFTVNNYTSLNWATNAPSNRTTVVLYRDGVLPDIPQVPDVPTVDSLYDAWKVIEDHFLFTLTVVTRLYALLPPEIYSYIALMISVVATFTIIKVIK